MAAYKLSMRRYFLPYGEGLGPELPMFDSDVPSVLQDLLGSLHVPNEKSRWNYAPKRRPSSLRDGNLLPTNNCGRPIPKCLLVLPDCPASSKTAKEGVKQKRRGRKEERMSQIYI